jgi:ferric-dicitrate binding protein FerR (iron transport regulator)
MSVSKANILKDYPGHDRRDEGLSGAILDEAIAWAVRIEFNTPDPRTRETFDAWLLASPRHADAWHRLQGLQNDFKGVPPKLVLDTLLEECSRLRSIE